MYFFKAVCSGAIPYSTRGWTHRREVCQLGQSTWTVPKPPLTDAGDLEDYSLVMTNITMETHHLQWLNPLSLW